jgi:hypothetical protein
MERKIPIKTVRPSAPVLADFPDLNLALHLDHFFQGCDRAVRTTKNPRPFPAVGCCQNRFLSKTNNPGVAAYDDYQQIDLSNVQ